MVGVKLMLFCFMLNLINFATIKCNNNDPTLYSELLYYLKQKGHTENDTINRRQLETYLIDLFNNKVGKNELPVFQNLSEKIIDEAPPTIIIHQLKEFLNEEGLRKKLKDISDQYNKIKQSRKEEKVKEMGGVKIRDEEKIKSDETLDFGDASSKEDL